MQISHFFFFFLNQQKRSFKKKNSIEQYFLKFVFGIPFLKLFDYKRLQKIMSQKLYRNKLFNKLTMFKINEKCRASIKTLLICESFLPLCCFMPVLPLDSCLPLCMLIFVRLSPFYNFLLSVIKK